MCEMREVVGGGGKTQLVVVVMMMKWNWKLNVLHCISWQITLLFISFHMWYHSSVSVKRLEKTNNNKIDIGNTSYLFIHDIFNSHSTNKQQASNFFVFPDFNSHSRKCDKWTEHKLWQLPFKIKKLEVFLTLVCVLNISFIIFFYRFCAFCNHHLIHNEQHHEMNERIDKNNQHCEREEREWVPHMNADECFNCFHNYTK